MCDFMDYIGSIIFGIFLFYFHLGPLQLLATNVFSVQEGDLFKILLGSASTLQVETGQELF